MTTIINSHEFREFREEFYKIYWDKIFPILKELEKERPKKLVKYIIINSLVFILGFGILFFNYYAAIFMTPVIIFTGLFLLFYMFNDYSKNLKKACMSKIMKAFNNIHWEDSYDIIYNKDLTASSLFSPFDTVTPYDAFSGEYKGIAFRISELALKRINGDIKSADLYPKIFRGVVIQFPYNKDIEARTIVVTKNDNSVNGLDSINHTPLGIVNLVISAIIALVIVGSHMDVLYYRPHVGWLIFFALTTVFYFCGSILYRLANTFIVKNVNCMNYSHDTKLKRINLEDVVFNKRFSAFSHDEVEGRYLLSPAFIERFRNLEMAFRAKNIKCSFNNGDLMIAMTTGNVFEIGNLFKKLDNPKNFEKFFDELTSVLYLVDYFKLDENTGL